MARADSPGPEGQPLPEGGWSEEIVTLREAVVVPPDAPGFVQPAGVLAADGSYCAHGVLWRKYRPLNSAPAMPGEVTDRLPGRWLWGGVLWSHFGHFLVESTARLWALDRDTGHFDGILFMPRRAKVGETVRKYHQEFIGLMARDLPIRIAAEPLRVEELVVPGQGFGLGRITAGTQSYRDAIHRRFATSIAPEGPERLYISRSALGLRKGGLLGEERLEELLAAEGYVTFHPQQHSISVQIARYKAAKRIIAADGSAVHLFAIVGRADQPLAIVMRRQSTANNLLVSNVTHFCGAPPLEINALRTEWISARGKQASNRLSFGELDHPAIGRALAEAGFIGATDWPETTEEERQEMFRAKGLGRKGRFTEAPHHVRRRVQAMRAARRARKAAQAES
ncbi:glycosyltransferase 61 family protein [Seohaeicola zhoushanensis]|uniref:Glycosyltransferase 61 catalytic domain-containing protein n=1 Tax=Seohaeicola zhoushanensis TaxID=1569283 RepID=A0A8J3GUE4_9RHOB|nr:glycosyltransferase 61 family protein [Seohaeicola zhoushanensis]GHF35227.1 hypothetical protein GCM10017056_03400 [Seohaeicola zhoushanensis]